MDGFNEALPPLKDFILPGGGQQLPPVTWPAPFAGVPSAAAGRWHRAENARPRYSHT